MKTSVRSAILAIAIVAGSLPAMAQSGQNSGQNSGSASDQFKSAGQHISQGAQGIGEGIKQGAIQFWDAVKAGAQTVGDKLGGHSDAPKAPTNSGQ